MAGFHFKCFFHLGNPVINSVACEIGPGEFHIPDRLFRSETDECLQRPDRARVVSRCDPLAGAFKMKSRCFRAMGQTDNRLVFGFNRLTRFRENMDKVCPSVGIHGVQFDGFAQVG